MRITATTWTAYTRQLARLNEKAGQLLADYIAAHGTGDTEALIDYADARVDHCPHMATKTFCSVCKTHCYKPEMREQIRQVMRWSGPRMLFHHPVLAIRHLVETRKQKKAQ